MGLGWFEGFPMELFSHINIVRLQSWRHYTEQKLHPVSSTMAMTYYESRDCEILMFKHSLYHCMNAATALWTCTYGNPNFRFMDVLLCELWSLQKQVLSCNKGRKWSQEKRGNKGRIWFIEKDRGKKGTLEKRRLISVLLCNWENDSGWTNGETSLQLDAEVTEVRQECTSV